MFMGKPFLSLLNMAYGPTNNKKKNWFFLGRKRFPEVEDDMNYGMILSLGLCISYMPQGFNVDWAGLGPY